MEAESRKQHLNIDEYELLSVLIKHEEYKINNDIDFRYDENKATSLKGTPIKQHQQ